MTTEQAIPNEGWIGAFVRRRTLTHYPHGTKRWGLLILTMLASVLASYEFHLAPVLPLMLPYLHLSKIQYGFFLSFGVPVGAIAAVYGGPLADRYGRVVVIDGCLAVLTVLVFANLFITNIPTFLVVRYSMGIIGGLIAGAIAALVRDMSPRVSRALAFALFTIGPVGSNWLVNFVAGKTLPIYHTWQSQFWITGCLSIAMFLPILFWLSDLSPELRMEVFRSEMAEREAQGKKHPAPENLPSGVRDAYARLLSHAEVWLLAIGVMAFLMFYMMVTTLGPLMFSEAFHYSPGDAARLNANFWLADAASLIVFGWVSDRLQIRKPIAIFGAILSTIITIYWIPFFGHTPPERTLAWLAAILGACMAMAYIPWAAQYSETLEEISPALQATGWAFFNLVGRVWGVGMSPLSLYVVSRYGWASWIKVCAGGIVFYIVAMALSRGPFYKFAQSTAQAPEDAAAALSQAGGA
ncbi:MAG TPA: MFS transporter [Candidatus Binataceae bacterium]|nr:MFS transporter [Candidatus Binataceae bacterium]